MIEREEDAPTQEFFNLSHASWLVLPRVALQSMPFEWQERFFALVWEMEETIAYPPGYTGRFAVTMKDGSQYVKNVLPSYRHNTLSRKER